MSPRPLRRRFYESDALEVAPALLHKVLVVGAVTGRIVEVEAYRGSDDAASHAFRGPTRRNATMFGPPGHLYVYFTYGMHWCANVVTGPPGSGQAVLLRALAPVTGVDLMRSRRPTCRRDRDLCAGPARLCAALGIDVAMQGTDLTRRHPAAPWIGEDGDGAGFEIARSTRIGITKAADMPWRWFVADDPHVSRRP
jgi:DNA-3-methyladenine glycosylase